MIQIKNLFSTNKLKLLQTISNKNDNMFTLVVYFKRMRYL